MSSIRSFAIPAILFSLWLFHLELRAAYKALLDDKLPKPDCACEPGAYCAACRAELEAMMDWCERFDELTSRYEHHRRTCAVCKTARVTHATTS